MQQRNNAKFIAKMNRLQIVKLANIAVKLWESVAKMLTYQFLKFLRDQIIRTQLMCIIRNAMLLVMWHCCDDP